MHRKIPFLLLLILLICTTAPWSTAVAQSQDGNLRVAVHLVDPFVTQKDGEYTGFSVDLWKALAAKLNVSYEWAPVASVQEQIDAVERRDADLALGAITISHDREEVVDFSYPYFRSGLLIMTPYQHNMPLRSLMDLVRAFFSPVIIQLLALLLGAMFVVANLVWLLERHRNEDFNSNYLKGLWDGFWWAAVTVSTVGYGDKTTKGAYGRILSLVWIFVGLFLITQFMAGVTATLAVQHLHNQIADVSNLKNRKVVTVADTTSAEYLKQLQVRPTTVDAIDEAFRMLEAGQADAIVYDGPVLQHYAATHEDKDVIVTAEAFRTEMYGIALPTDSPYLEQINLAILAMMESGEYDTIYANWFGQPPP